MPSNASAKGELRKQMRSVLDLMSPEDRRLASSDIARRISVTRGSNCAFFSGLAREPQLLSLLSDTDVQWFLPRVVKPGVMTFHQVTNHCCLTAGPFGILEPQPDAPQISPKDLDVILCPGLAFSLSGQRLGQGGGFYDRFLPSAIKARLIGVCFDVQVREGIPFENHDTAMHEIITESRHLRKLTPAPPV